MFSDFYCIHILFSDYKMSEKFCVTWNDFKNNVTKSYEKLRKEKDFFDVTLVSEDEVLVEAHKLVLSACSPFFR